MPVVPCGAFSLTPAMRKKSMCSTAGMFWWSFTEGQSPKGDTPKGDAMPY